MPEYDPQRNRGQRDAGDSGPAPVDGLIGPAPEGDAANATTGNPVSAAVAPRKAVVKKAAPKKAAPKKAPAKKAPAKKAPAQAAAKKVAAKKAAGKKAPAQAAAKKVPAKLAPAHHNATASDTDENVAPNDVERRDAPPPEATPTFPKTTTSRATLPPARPELPTPPPAPAPSGVVRVVAVAALISAIVLALVLWLRRRLR